MDQSVRMIAQFEEDFDEEPLQRYLHSASQNRGINHAGSTNLPFHLNSFKQPFALGPAAQFFAAATKCTLLLKNQPNNLPFLVQVKVAPIGTTYYFLFVTSPQGKGIKMGEHRDQIIRCQKQKANQSISRPFIAHLELSVQLFLPFCFQNFFLKVLVLASSLFDHVDAQNNPLPYKLLICLENVNNVTDLQQK